VEEQKGKVFMRAAAVAIVLIVGAAVILVFANTLNSWVIGGLIGGLAALLISIPISLFLFTILSRRHDQKLQAFQQELEEMGYADLDENGYAEVYETDVYVLPDEEEYYNEPVSRRMSDVRALPAAGQSQASANIAYNERTGRYPQGYRRPSQALPRGRGKGTPTQDLSSDRRQPMRSTHDVNAMRSRYQTAALRAARREAAQQFDDVEFLPTHSPTPYKRVPPERSSQPLTEQPARFRQARHESDVPPSQQMAIPDDSRRGIDATSGRQYGARRTTSSGEPYSTNRPSRTDSLRMNEPKTDQLHGRYLHPETEPFQKPPQTGQMVRKPRLGEQLRNPDMITGSLKNPLVRRAPYMYEDDPLREELAQQIDGGPITRRSSLFAQYEDEEE
jgi:hypothetical protein